MLLNPGLAYSTSANLLLTPMLISAEAIGEKSRGVDWFVIGEEAKICLANPLLVTSNIPSVPRMPLSYSQKAI